MERSCAQIPATTLWLTTILNEIWCPLLICSQNKRGANRLTAGVVLEMHGNITEKQAGYPGPLTQYEPQTRGDHTNTQEHMRGQAAQSQGSEFMPPTTREDTHPGRPGIYLLDGC